MAQSLSIHSYTKKSPFQFLVRVYAQVATQSPMEGVQEAVN